MSVVSRGVVARPQQSEPGLAQPPTDVEKEWYLQRRQGRWLILAQAASYTLIACGLTRFALSAPALWFFLLPMAMFSTAMVVSLVSGTRRRRVTRASHRRTVAAWAPAVHPTVDVFLPSAGEPLAVLANTYHHVAGLRWPLRPRVLVLDDSGRESVRELAEAHGFDYHCRPDRGRLQKAGNLLHGYGVSDGDLIVVLDADFVPRPDFLEELVPYFDDPDVGIVQSPQFFETHDPAMGWLQRCAGATQELFYRWIQPARDSVGAAICVGTSAIYRRAALARSGGFAQIGHSEDVHTGVKMLKAGFALRYVPVLVTRGLCPDDIRSFLNQQYRWCRGSMSLLADRSFHATTRLSVRQKLCFWSGFLYFITTALGALAAPLPGLAMVWFFPAFVAPWNSVWLVGALLLWTLVLPLTMRSRWRIDVLRVQVLYSFAHLTAIAHVLTGRTRAWVPTGAAGRGTPLATTILRFMRGYLGVAIVLLWAGLLRGLAVHGLDAYWAMLLLGGLSLYIHLPLLVVGTAGQWAGAPPTHARGTRRRRRRPGRLALGRR